MQVNQVRLGAVLSYVSMGLSTLISLIYTPIMLDRLGETEYGVYGTNFRQASRFRTKGKE